MEKIVLTSTKTREEEKTDSEACRSLTAITPCPRCGSLILTHTGQYITWDQVMASDLQFVKDIDHMTFDTEAPIHAGAYGIYACPQQGITKEI